MANRFWVGGSGNWSDTARWSTTSGGAGGASVPGNNDMAFVDANSDGGAPFTITLNSSATVGALQIYGTVRQCYFSFGTNTLTFYYLSGTPSCYIEAGISCSGTTGGISATNALNLTSFSALPNVSTAANSGYTFLLGTNLTVNGTFTWAGCVVNQQSYNLTCDNFTTSTSNTKVWSRSGTSAKVYITGNNKTVVSLTSSGFGGYGSTIDFVLNYSGSTGQRTVSCVSSYASFANFAVSAGSDLVNFQGGGSTQGYIGSLDLTGFTGSLAIYYGLTIYGTVCILPNSFTWASTAALYFALSQNCTLTTGGAAHVLNCNIYAGSVNSYALAFGSDINIGSNIFNLNRGTVNLAGFTLKCPRFVVSPSYYVTVEFAGGVVETGSWVGPSSGYPLTASTTAGTIRMKDTYAGLQSFTGGNSGLVSYANVTLEKADNNTLQILDAGYTIPTFTNASTGATSITFAAGYTHRIQTFNASGYSPTALTNLVSSSTGSTWALEATNAVRVSNVYIRDSIASYTNTSTYVATNSQSGGNNTRWSFFAPGGLLAFF